MSSQPRSLTPIQFLSAGNILSAGLQLYRKQFKEYARLAAVGTAWFVVPLIVLVGSVFGLVQSGNAGWLIAIVPISLGLLLMGFAKYQAFAAAIARKSFGELILTPETSAAASQYTNRRMWGFWLISFLLSLLFMGLFIGFYILLTILLVILIFAVTGLDAITAEATPNDATLMAIGFATLGLLAVVGIPAIIFFLWMLARFFVPEVVYAIEPTSGAAASLGRSWNLTTKSGWRVVLLLMLVVAVLTPFQVLFQVVSSLLQLLAISLDPVGNGGFFVSSFVGSYALGIGLSILLLPIWQCTKAVLYYDLRSRREGMGLTIESQDGSAASVMQLFQRVSLVTPESVELEFTLAGIGNRIYAILVDYTILLMGSILFWTVWGIFSYQLLTYLEQAELDYSGLSLWLLAIGLLLFFIGTTAYFVGFEVLRQGQTPGKRAAKIRVIRDDGRPIGLAQAVLRSLIQPIDFFLFLGAFLIFFGKREKRLGDWAAGTVVIQENRANQRAITLSDAAKSFAVDLPQQANLAKLQPDQFAVISEYLQRRSFMSRLAEAELSLNLARQVRSVIQLETIPDGMTSDVFLEAAYLAYQEQFSGY